MGIDVFNDVNTEIIIGNPGCGKTTALVNKVKELIDRGISPTDIAYFSFSVAAVEEAISRTMKACNKEREEFPFFRTIHSMAFTLLGLNTQQVMQGYHIIDFGKLHGLKFSAPTIDRAKRGTMPAFKDDAYMECINVSRLLDMSIREYMTTHNKDFADVAEVETLAIEYERYKKSKGLYDYTDMLLLANKAMVTIPKFKYMIIDEAQDLSTMQWLIVEKLAERTSHIIIAGDDKQTINEFAGADLEYFLNIKAHITVLKQSYRVPKRVYNMANRLVEKMSRKRPSTWVPREEEGSIRRVDELPLEDMRRDSWLVLARTNAQLQRLREQLIGNLGVICPLYLINEEMPIDKEVFKAISLFKALGNLRCNPNSKIRDKYTALAIDPDNDTLEMRKRKINNIMLFKKFINSEMPASVELDDHFAEQYSKKNWIDAFDKIPLQDRLYIARVLPHYEKDNDIYKKARIRLCTIHGAKGSEADNVVLFTSVTPTQRRLIADGDDSELRLLYVAITRTKKNLYLLNSNRKSLSYIDLL